MKNESGTKYYYWLSWIHQKKLNVGKLLFYRNELSSSIRYSQQFYEICHWMRISLWSLWQCGFTKGDAAAMCVLTLFYCSSSLFQPSFTPFGSASCAIIDKWIRSFQILLDYTYSVLTWNQNIFTFSQQIVSLAIIPVVCLSTLSSINR